MVQTPIPNIIQRILNFSLILIFLSTFIVLVIGASTKNIRQEVLSLNAFLEGTEMLQENFERSLAMYTDEPRKIIDFVLNIRPKTDMEYINFISEVEDIGEELGLNFDLQSINDSEELSSGNTLGYHVKFYGSQDDLIAFSYAIENMPYYIRLDSIDYKSLDLLEENVPPNVNFKIYLYVRENK